MSIALHVASLVFLLALNLRAAATNIVLILADDMGFSDLGCYGSEIATPNLDRLASGGVRFTQFYNMARCCPTRAALLTGLYPQQAGVGHMCQDLGQPGYEGRLNDRCVTIAEALRDGGYATAMVGKWHLSNLTIGGGNPLTKKLLSFEVDGPISPDKSSWPVNRGFDEHYGTIAGVGSFFDPYSLVHNEQPVRPEAGFYYSDFISDHAVRFIEQLSGGTKPFFLYLAHTAPHWPMQATDEAAIARYQSIYESGWDAIRQRRLERMTQLGIVPPGTTLPPREGMTWEEAEDKPWQARRMAVYAAMIEQMDRGIGRVIEAIRERGIEQNTLVVFLSDNGACAEHVQPNWYDVPTRTRDGREIRVGNQAEVSPGGETTFQSYGPEWANASNTPLRHFKHYTEEGGIAAPCIVRWPGVVREGRIETRAVGHVIDVMPTLLSAAGVAYPTELNGKAITPIEGVNLLPGLKGEEFDRGPIYWEHEGNRAVRVGDWKLVAAHGKSWQLFDLARDRNELRDLANDEPRRVEEMKTLYDAWAERVGVKAWPVTGGGPPGSPRKQGSAREQESRPVPGPVGR